MDPPKQKKIGMPRRHFGEPLVKLMKDRDWAGVIARSKTAHGKREIRQRDMFGCLPLHVACCEKAPLEVLELILDEYPESVKAFGRYGVLPLHIVCYMKCPIDVIRGLIRAYPKGVKTRSRAGRFPIHYACFRHCSAEVIQELVYAFPRGARLPDEFGYLPIHREMSREPGPRLEVVRALLDAYPDAAHMPNMSGTSWTKFLWRERGEREERELP